MSEDRIDEVKTNMVKGLSLGFIYCHPKGKADWKLNTTKGKRKARGSVCSQCNARYENNIASTGASKNLPLNDSLSQSGDQKSSAIAKTAGRIKIAQKKNWDANLKDGLM